MGMATKGDRVDKRNFETRGHLCLSIAPNTSLTFGVFHFVFGLRKTHQNKVKHTETHQNKVKQGKGVPTARRSSIVSPSESTAVVPDRAGSWGGPFRPPTVTRRSQCYGLLT